MNEHETEQEIAYEWIENPIVVRDVKALVDWQRSVNEYQIKDSIYDSPDKELSKLKVGVRVRSKAGKTTLTAKRYKGQGKSGESIFDEFHKDLNSGNHPDGLMATELNLGLPEVEIIKYLEFTNRRVEVVFSSGDSKILFVNERVTYANTDRAYTESVLEVEFSDVAPELIDRIRAELESTYKIAQFHEGKTDRAERYLSQLSGKPLKENANDTTAIKMSAHGGKGLMEMKFFHQPYNAFASPEVDTKVLGYQRSNWDFFGYAKLPIGAEIKEHLHDKTDEIYFILKGSATMTIDGIESVIRDGDCILTRKGSIHGVKDVTADLEFIATEIKA